MSDIPKENTGVIEGSGTKQLWIAGSIPYEVRLNSGDWRAFLSSGEQQYSNNVDTMACVSFSHTNDLEIQGKFLGNIHNFSDRFLAKMSDTTPQGNYLDKVADTSRVVGLVQENEWPSSNNYTWASYYAEIPQEVKNKAVKQPIAYETIGRDKDSLIYHLKQCPIQITIPAPHPNHAVVLVHIEGNTAYYFDSYPGTTNYLKTINVSLISYALKIVLRGTMSNAIPVTKAGTQEQGFYLPATSEEALKDKALNLGINILDANGNIDYSKFKVISGL